MSTFLSDETRFQHWMAWNPNEEFDCPLADEKVGAWQASSSNCIVGKIFFDRTVNTQVFLTVYKEFYEQLTDNEKKDSSFEQDGAIYYTSNDSLNRVRTVSRMNELSTGDDGLHVPQSCLFV